MFPSSLVDTRSRFPGAERTNISKRHLAVGPEVSYKDKPMNWERQIVEHETQHDRKLDDDVTRSTIVAQAPGALKRMKSDPIWANLGPNRQKLVEAVTKKGNIGPMLIGITQSCSISAKQIRKSSHCRPKSAT